MTFDFVDVSCLTLAFDGVIEGEFAVLDGCTGGVVEVEKIDRFETAGGGGSCVDDIISDCDGDFKLSITLF